MGDLSYAFDGLLSNTIIVYALSVILAFVGGIKAKKLMDDRAFDSDRKALMNLALIARQNSRGFRWAEPDGAHDAIQWKVYDSGTVIAHGLDKPNAEFFAALDPAVVVRLLSR